MPLRNIKLLDDKQIDIDPNGKHGLLLNDLQGNILSSHARTYSLHLFLRFPNDAKNKVKVWIEMLAQQVTSAEQQYQDTSKRKYVLKKKNVNMRNRSMLVPGADDLPFVNFFLTSAGYKYFDLKPPRDKRFNEGMQKTWKVLNDPPPKQWEFPEEIHAMILIANDDKEKLSTQALAKDMQLFLQGRQLKNEKGEIIAHVLKMEQGTQLFKRFNGVKRIVEHFGYSDGISQPRFLKKDKERVKGKISDGNDGGDDYWKPWAPLKLALIPDPWGGNHATGSFMVFRKLEQNVRKFQTLKHQLVNLLDGDFSGPAVAYAVGKFQDGTPLTRQDRYNFPINDFNYKAWRSYPEDHYQDVNGILGRRCPFHSHIRAVNRREDENSPVSERDRRIVRRGIPYDERSEAEQKYYQVPDDRTSPEKLPSKNVGLLFMCFQRDIQSQFEFLQRRANGDVDPDSPNSTDPASVDPIIGKHFSPEDQPWPAQWNEEVTRTKTFKFCNVVTFKGGEYFFAPSKSCLEKIGQATILEPIGMPGVSQLKSKMTGIRKKKSRTTKTGKTKSIKSGKSPTKPRTIRKGKTKSKMSNATRTKPKSTQTGKSKSKKSGVARTKAKATKARKLK